MITEKVLQSIGNSIGAYVKSDPTNFNQTWKVFTRIRVTLNIDKPLKRRMKIKREGNAWGWINFKYERLSTFCFVCGLLGHSDRECPIVYANPEKVIERSYGAWLRAPMRNTRNQNVGARWLRNGVAAEVWNSNKGEESSSRMAARENREGARFMEVDGQLTRL